ncbi:unnamed protein product, partial [Adineta ricciae]
QLLSEILRKFERKDLIQFYDHYISPRSPHRRKLMVFVRPSPLASSLNDEIPEIKINEKATTTDLPEVKYDL